MIKLIGAAGAYSSVSRRAAPLYIAEFALAPLSLDRRMEPAMPPLANGRFDLPQAPSNPPGPFPATT